MSEISRLSLFKPLCRNTVNIGRNYLHHLSQDPALLKTNAFIGCSLVLVLSRIAIANASAQQAKNTPDAPHRKREAIKTTFREAAGFTFSYLVLKVIQGLTKVGLARYFGVENIMPENGLIDSLGQLGKLWKQWAYKQPLETIHRIVNAVDGAATEPILNDLPVYASRFKRWESKLNWFTIDKHFRLHPEWTQLAKLKSTLRWFPVLFGSIPTIFLSGYLLERYSLDYSEKVIETLNTFFGGGKKTGRPALMPLARDFSPRLSPSTSYQQAYRTTPPRYAGSRESDSNAFNLSGNLSEDLSRDPVSLTTQRFSAFMQRVQQAQQERIHS